MKKVFFAFSSGVGPLIRCLPIANELKKSGYSTHFFAIDKARNYMEYYNHEFTEINIYEPLPQYIRAKDPYHENLSSYFGFIGYEDSDYVLNNIKYWKESMATLKPDVIISDCCIEAIIVAKSLDIPVIVITQSVCDTVTSMRYWENNHNASQNTKVIRNINAAIEKYGCNKLNYINTIEELHFIGDATVYPSVPEIDPYKEDVVFTGPILWEGHMSGIDINIDYEKLKKDNKPVISVYPGRLNDLVGDSGLLIIKLLFETFKHIDANIIFSTGGLDEVPDDLNIPSNVNVYNWLPIETMYSISDLTIHHGGHGSCLASLKYGVPTLALATHTEREYNSRRLQETGIGLFRDPRRISVSECENVILELLKEKYNLKAKALSEDIRSRSYTGEFEIVRIIEQILNCKYSK